MAKQQRGAYLSDGTYKKKSGSRSNPDSNDPPGRGPSASGFKNMQKGRMDPLTEIQQLVAGAGADPIGAGPSSMRGMAQMLGHQANDPMSDPRVQQILAMILGPQAAGPAIMPMAGDDLTMMGDDEGGPNEGAPPDPRLARSRQLRDVEE